MKQLILIGRLVFGAWMLAEWRQSLLLSFWPLPTGHEPLAIQLMDALVHSRLIDVAMAIQLITGALILAGIFVPVALCVVMPVSTCAVYWALILDHQPLGSVLALAAFALNGLLLLALHRLLQRGATATCADGRRIPGDRASYDFLFVSATGRSTRAEFVPALIVLVAVVLFYAYL